MTTTTTTVSAAADRTSATPAWLLLARIEMIRYARRPAFLFGAVLTLAALLPYLDPAEPVDELSMIAPAALIGLIGITLSAQRVWASDRCADAAGSTPVSMAARTLAHLAACLVPFTVGLVFVAVSYARYLTDPPPASGYAALMSDGWVLAVWFALGAMSCLGGPILGVLIARMTDRRAAPILISVGLVALAIVFQGLFEPLRRIRVFMPWTYWGGPFGIDGDPQRSIVLTGSPHWWAIYLLVLCAIAALMALRRDHTWRSPRNGTALAALVVTAVLTCLAAMWTGTPDTIVNPLPGDGTSWGG
ncbi:MAG: hypothetical protein Q8K63_15090 [Acidimicrobiales bacterium]|nr:hypothetical protein [Acidimicrobiales bacterium]